MSAQKSAARASNRVLCVVGARPNLMKMAPLLPALLETGLRPFLVHTGQHYDARLSQVFFDQLGLPKPDVHLGVGSGSHAQQTAAIMNAFEPVCLDLQPDLVAVVGDVNSTLACALVAAKLRIPVAHIEAGLRSFDREMPEEINRVVTDHVSDLLFTTEPSANQNLAHEGVPRERVHFVGNCMVDTLLRHIEAARRVRPWRDQGLDRGNYALVTVHRPQNVDQPDRLQHLLDTLGQIGEQLPVFFPMHPRTKARVREAALRIPKTVNLAEPMPYLPFVGLMAEARLVLTDSGGIQEETTALGVPCLTLRHNTERPITIESGTNRLVGSRREAILAAVEEVLRGPNRSNPRPTPPLWDGKAAPRVAEHLMSFLQNGVKS